MHDDGARRFLIATGTTRCPLRHDLDDRPELADEIEAVRALFANRSGGAHESLGYRDVPGFGPDLTTAELKAKLRGFLTHPDRTSDDYVVFYYTGHGEVDDSGEFLLPFPDTTHDVVGTALPASELARWLLFGTDVQRLLIILDTCHAGAAGSELAARATTALGRLRAVANRPRFAILTATRPREQAYSGVFTQALRRAIHHRATAGHEPRYLALDAVVDVINADSATPASQHAQLLTQGEAAGEFLPNPRYNQWLRGLDLRTQLDRQQRLDREREFRDHVLPRAQGLDAPRDGLWLFTGRHAVLRDLSSWLRDRSRDGTARVVTGDPGSGKSSVLARLTVLARPEHLRKVPRIHELPGQTIPPRGSVDVFIHARGQTGDQVLAALASAAGVEAERPGDLLAALTDRPHPFVAVIDALDEATDPDHLTARVLAPLVRGAPHSSLRLALGTRRHLIDRLGGPVECLNLDSSAYADPVSVHAYVRRCLVDLVEDSPYRALAEPVTDAVAHAVAVAAGRSFLVAQITSRSLAMRPDVANPYDPEWRDALPRLAADAMRLDLDQRLGLLATKARDLLRPLAYALGSGLPWEDVWAPMAAALAGRPYTNHDLDWLVREAGFYIVEALEGARSVYRLYHEALAEHLRGEDDEQAIHRMIVQYLTARTPAAAGRTAWSRAHPYVRAHLASHAAAAGTLDDLVADSAYLLAADHAPLLANLPTLRTEEGRGAARAYRRVIRHLRGKPPEEHASYLELAAHCYEAPRLAEDLGTYNGGPWQVSWTQWVRLGRDVVIRAHADRVRDITIVKLDERPVVVSGSDDGTVRVWDLSTGTALGRPFDQHHGLVRTVAAGLLGERPVAVSGSDDSTIFVWDLATGALVLPPITDHQRVVRSLAVADVSERLILASGSFDNTVRVRDLSTGEPVGQPFTRHSGGLLAVGIGRSSWRPIVASADADGHLHVWDPTSGSVLHTFATEGSFPVAAMVVAEIAQRPVLVTATGSAGSTGTIGVWDLATMAPVGEPMVGAGSVPRSLAIGTHGAATVVASGYDDGTIQVWDLATGSPAGQRFTGHTGNIHALRFAELDDLPVIVSGSADGTVRVWDLTSGANDLTPLSTHLRGIHTVASGVLAGRPVVATGSDDKAIRLWDCATGAALGPPLVGNPRPVDVVAVGTVENRPVVVSGTSDGTVTVWDVGNGDPLSAPRLIHGSPICALALTTRNGRSVVVSGGADGSIRVWDPLSGRQATDPVMGYLYPLMVLEVGRSRSKLVTVNGDGEPAMWGPSYSHRAFRANPDRGTPAPLFAVVDGEPVIVAVDADGSVVQWALTDPGQSMVRSRPRLRLVRREPPNGKPRITAITYHPSAGLVTARGSVLDFAGYSIELDAEVTAMTCPDTGSVVVATKFGLVRIIRGQARKET